MEEDCRTKDDLLKEIEDLKKENEQLKSDKVKLEHQNDALIKQIKKTYETY